MLCALPIVHILAFRALLTVQMQDILGGISREVEEKWFSLLIFIVLLRSHPFKFLIYESTSYGYLLLDDTDGSRTGESV